MTYKLVFLDDAWKEWKKLNPSIRQQFQKKLKERLASPHIPKARLYGLKSCYKIKLSRAGYRMVYQVIDSKVKVSVISIGKREGSAVYKSAAERLD